MKQVFITFVAVLICFSFSVSTVWAQGGDGLQQIVEPSAAQLELNDQGVEAIINRNFAQASRLFQASLDLGELNITYVNLGRAFQYLNECEKAEQAYARALTAPAIPEPTPAEIAEVVERYREELKHNCKPSAAPGGNQADTKPGDTDASQGKSVQAPPTPAESSSSHVPYYWLGGGAAAVLTGVALDVFPASAGNGEFDTLDVVPIGLYAVGVGALVYGVILLID